MSDLHGDRGQCAYCGRLAQVGYDGPLITESLFICWGCINALQLCAECARPLSEIEFYATTQTGTGRPLCLSCMAPVEPEGVPFAAGVRGRIEEMRAGR